MQETKIATAYLLTVGIENVTCFGKRQEISFTNKDGRPEQLTIITGLNGSGKTSLLRAIALLTDANPKNLLKHSGWNPDRLENESASVLVGTLATGTFLTEKATVSETADIRRELEGGKVTENVGPVFPLLFGYGPYRFPDYSKTTGKAENPASSTLFLETDFLGDPESWLKQANKLAAKNQNQARLLHQAQVLITKVMPDLENLRFGIKGNTAGAPEFKTPLGWLPYSKLSRGHRSVIAWLLDFNAKMCENYPGSENPLAEPAIMLVDEIEQHLHPKWQRRILKTLSRQFPNTQFIVTTNSPLIVQSAPDANLILLKQKGNRVEVKQDLGQIKNWRIDQVLTSPYFGLKSARPRETAKLMRKRDKLLGKPELTDIDRVTITRLDQKIGTMPYGETEAEIKADAIIKSLASKLKSEGRI